MAEIVPPAARIIQRVLQERFPNLRLGPGSALHRLLVAPAEIVLTDPYKTLSVMRRNMSLANADVMLPHELDELAANWRVSRADGTRAFGRVRIYFDEPRNSQITTTAVVADTAGHNYSPTSTRNVTAAELEANVDDASAQFFVEVDVRAVDVGEAYRIEANAIETVQGIPGAVRAANLARFSGGSDAQSNAAVVDAIDSAVTNREVVSSGGIESRLRDQFGSRILTVKVVGYGDEEMGRDVIDAVTSMEMLFSRSFCQKYNVALDANGDVTTDSIEAPVGAKVGAIRDLTGLDFRDLLLTQDGVRFERTAITPGMSFRLYQKTGSIPDPDIGDYQIKRVVEERPVEGAAKAVLLVLDRPFSVPDPEPFDEEANADLHGFTVLGPVNTNTFHVGGKVDVYIDTVSDEEREVVVSALEPVDGATGIYEIPLVDFVPTNSTGTPLFEDATAFAQPVITVLRVEQVSFDDDRVVERTLNLGTNYTIIRAESRSRFTPTANDVLRITDDNTGDSLFGRRIRITYLTNPDIEDAQTFLSGEDVENKGIDLQVIGMAPVTLDVEFTYSGGPDQATVAAEVAEYVRSRSANGTVTAYDINAMLVLIGVTNVSSAIKLVATRVADDGTVSSESSDVELRVDSSERFVAASPLSITRI